MSTEAIFKAYDIRGLSPEQLTPELAYCIGRAFVKLVEADQIVVGRDMRPSGDPLSKAFSGGAVDEGAEVIDIGLVSTDLAYFASGMLDLPAAMLTASHNPAQYNGIKLCRAGAAPIGIESGLAEIRDMALEMSKEHIPSKFPTKNITQRDLLNAFTTHVHKFISPYNLRKLKVVVDTGNGMGGLVVPRVFDELPFKVEILYGELDGTFPNHPADPLQPENLVDLQKSVLDLGADIGLAFDGDADRVFLVDEKAQPVPGSTTTAIVAASMLDRADEKGERVIHNLICSRSVPEVITEHGGVPVQSRVGHSFIKGDMAETNALFGGEHSGHYYFRDNYRADSGLIAAVIVLGVLSEADQPLSELRKQYERYFASGEINSEVADPQAKIEQLSQRFDSCPQLRLDGLSIDCGDWWCNVRPSNTEPLVRLNLEAGSQELCDLHTDEMLKLIREEA